MFGKACLVLALFTIGGNCFTEIWLTERNLTYIKHEYLGTSISIPKNFWDTLTSCHVIFPNNARYEVFPQYVIPHPTQNVFFLNATQPYTSCGIGFRNIGPLFSGTYQLLSTVLHSADNSVTLTRQNFNMVVVESDFT